jgi:hypothetical protein
MEHIAIGLRLIEEISMVICFAHRKGKVYLGAGRGKEGRSFMPNAFRVSVWNEALTAKVLAKA